MLRSISLAIAVIAAAAVGSVNCASAQTEHRIVTADMLQWGPAPPSMPKGSQVAVLAGNPGESGLFALQVKFADGYVVPPHWHAQAELVTVLSGRLNVGAGDTLDRSQTQPLGPGGFALMPAKMPHYVWASGETVIQLTGMGPFEITYIDPSNDPRLGTTGAR
jgi:quercetin dioxygenase-like cupin family protein